MSPTRPARLPAAVLLAVATVVAGPSAAQATPASSALPSPATLDIDLGSIAESFGSGLGHVSAVFGLNVGSIVTKIISKVVDWIVPDFASGWAISLIRWLVAVPSVTDVHAYPHLNSFRSAMVGVGFALLAVTSTIAFLQTAAGRPEAGQALHRTVVAAAAIVFYPKMIEVVVLATNILTGSMITNHLVVDGTDKMLGATLTGAIATNGIGASLLVGVATVCAYFVAALMVLKIGLLALQAVFFLAGVLVWGLYPLRSTAWLARAWASAGLTLAAVPIAWALVFSAAALLTSDSLVWSTQGGLSDQLQQIAKPCAALACLWVAKAAPGFLLTAARSMGMHPAAIAGMRHRGGSASGSSQTGAARGSSGVQTNADRFRGLGLAIGARAAPVAAQLRSRAVGVRAAASLSFARHAAPAPNAIKNAAGAAAKAGGVAAALATAPVKANSAYKTLAAKGAAARLTAAAPAAPTAIAGRGRAGGRGPASSAPASRTAAPVAPPSPGPATPAVPSSATTTTTSSARAGTGPQQPNVRTIKIPPAAPAPRAPAGLAPPHNAAAVTGPPSSSSLARPPAPASVIGPPAATSVAPTPSLPSPAAQASPGAKTVVAARAPTPPLPAQEAQMPSEPAPPRPAAPPTRRPT